MLRVIFLLILSLTFVGCASSDKKAKDAASLFARAQEYENDDRFEEAIRRYQEVRTKFPYSPQALQAELAVADVYYKQESYAESQVAYQGFRDLHPKHPKLDYVSFRYAMSVYMQLPETIDRDLSLAPDAILAFNDVLKKYPQSEYVKEAQEKRSDLIKKMAEKEIYIADFYFFRKSYEAALPRYENAIQEYSGIGFDEKLLIRAAYSSYKIGDPTKARRYLSKLKEDKIKSSETKSLMKEIRL